jgi:hypothetical protein
MRRQATAQTHYVVPGYRRKQNDFYFEYKQHGVANNSQWHNFDFHHITGGIWQSSVKYPGGPSWCVEALLQEILFF